MGGKAGIMMRQDISGDSPHVFCFLSGTEGAWMGYRSAAGDKSFNRRWTSNFQHNKLWLRLEKRLNTFNCMKSIDNGTTWKTIYQVTLDNWDSSKFESGLAVTSSNSWRASEVIFENFEHEEYYFPSASPTISRSPSYLPFLDKSATAIIHSFVSNRYIYALKWRTWEDGVGASTGIINDKHDMKKWKFVPQTCGDYDECYHIKNVYSGRCLYAIPDKSWEEGVGAGECIYEGNKWFLESVNCGENVCYYIKNAKSYRRLYAKANMNGEKGYGAQQEEAEGDMYKWFIEAIF